MTKPLHSAGYSRYAAVCQENDCLLEIRPRVLDHTTIQIAVSFHYTPTMTPKTQQRIARLESSITGLSEALAWCRSQRMGAKIETVRLDAPPDYIIEAADAYETYKNPWRSVHNALTQTTMMVKCIPQNHRHDAWEEERTCEPAPTFSHRIVFKKMEDAFAFKMRWC